MRGLTTISTLADSDTFFTCSGDDVHLIYKPIVDSYGKVQLEVAGKESISEMIQSYASQTDMSYIMARLKAGDTSVLGDQARAMYGDFTGLPTSRAEFMQSFIDAQLTFDKLPLDVRANFANDFKQWFVQAGTADWMTKMHIELPKTAQVEQPQIECAAIESVQVASSEIAKES